jgi:hypothetical protein
VTGPRTRLTWEPAGTGLRARCEDGWVYDVTPYCDGVVVSVCQSHNASNTLRIIATDAKDFQHAREIVLEDLRARLPR